MYFLQASKKCFRTFCILGESYITEVHTYTPSAFSARRLGDFMKYASQYVSVALSWWTFLFFAAMYVIKSISCLFAVNVMFVCYAVMLMFAVM